MATINYPSLRLLDEISLIMGDLSISCTSKSKNKNKTSQKAEIDEWFRQFVNFVFLPSYRVTGTIEQIEIHCDKLSESRQVIAILNGIGFRNVSVKSTDVYSDSLSYSKPTFTVIAKITYCFFQSHESLDVLHKFDFIISEYAQSIKQIVCRDSVISLEINDRFIAHVLYDLFSKFSDNARRTDKKLNLALEENKALLQSWTLTINVIDFFDHDSQF